MNKQYLTQEEAPDGLLSASKKLSDGSIVWDTYGPGPTLLASPTKDGGLKRWRELNCKEGDPLAKAQLKGVS